MGFTHDIPAKHSEVNVGVRVNVNHYIRPYFCVEINPLALTTWLLEFLDIYVFLGTAPVCLYYLVLMGIDCES